MTALSVRNCGDIERSLTAPQSFWERHKIGVCSTVVAIGIITAVALAILCWPASFAFIGAAAITGTFAALPLGAKIGIVVGGGLGAAAISAIGATRLNGDVSTLDPADRELIQMVLESAPLSPSSPSS